MRTYAAVRGTYARSPVPGNRCGRPFFGHRVTCTPTGRPAFRRWSRTAATRIASTTCRRRRRDGRRRRTVAVAGVTAAVAGGAVAVAAGTRAAGRRTARTGVRRR